MLLLVHLCLEVSLLFVAESKQNLFYVLKVWILNKPKLTRALCLPVHICAVPGTRVAAAGSLISKSFC